MTAIPIRDMSSDWNLDNRYEATSDVSVLVSNTGVRVVYWTHTTDSTLPPHSPRQLSPLKPGEKERLSLRSGEFLWFAGDEAHINLEVMPV